jgi:signal transduction histidine kinase
MRRRLFWTIAGVAAITGLIVLVGTVFASQRAAVEATQRELAHSSREIVTIIEDTVEQAQRRPGGLIEVIRLLEGDQLRPTLGRIRRTAGSSTLAIAAIGPEGLLGSDAELFTRLDLDEELLESGESQFLRSTRAELVMVTPVTLTTRNDFTVTLLIGLAREAPVVVLGDMGRGVLLIGVAILALAGLLARVLSRQIARRLDPLSAASRDLADGDLSARVPDLGDPELDDVAEAFNEMAEALESTNEREREFLLGVGHDLRTPLTTIGGYAEALESGDLDDDEVERIGGVLTKQTGQLRRLIEDLTLLARLDQPEFDLRMERVEVIGHVAGILESYGRKADEAGVGLSADLEGAIEVGTDPDRLAQIVQNLLENALRFTPEAGTVEVSVDRVDDAIEIRVSDTGIGIDPDDLPNVFDRHFVGRQRRVRNEGSGLGLSIVKGLTDRLGGAVEAESQPGRGTTVTVRLPGSN